MNNQDLIIGDNPLIGTRDRKSPGLSPMELSVGSKASRRSSLLAKGKLNPAAKQKRIVVPRMKIDIVP